MKTLWDSRLHVQSVMETFSSWIKIPNAKPPIQLTFLPSTSRAQHTILAHTRSLYLTLSLVSWPFLEQFLVV